MRGWIGSEWEGALGGTLVSSANGKACLSACSPSAVGNYPCQPYLRTLEGIKVKLQSLSNQTGATERVEKEGNMTAACDLVEDLRDAIVEYQVSTNICNTHMKTRSQCGS